MRKHELRFIKINDGMPNNYELNIADDWTCEFLVNLENLLEKNDVQVRAIRPNGIHNYCNLYLYHKDWKWLQKIIKVNITYDAKLSGKHKVIDAEILPSFWAKGRRMYKKAMGKEQFNDFVKYWLSAYITNNWNDVYLVFPE